MAERRPSSGAGGGEISAALKFPNPPQQDFETSMMILQKLQQQQQQQQQHWPGQQPQLQQRATLLGRRRQQEKQQIRPGLYLQQQQQQYVHPSMAYEASVYLQGRPTGAGPPQNQNMQESSPGTDRLRDYNSASRAVGIYPESNVQAPRSVLDLYPTAFPSLHELSELTARWVAEHNHKEWLRRKNSALRYPESVGINPNFSSIDAPSFLDLRHLAWSPLDTLSQMAARVDELHEYERSFHRRSG